MSSALQPIRAMHDCQSPAFEAPRSKFQGGTARPAMFTKNIFCNGWFSRCGNTAMIGTQARIHRLENIGIPTIARAGCVPLGRLKLFLPYRITFFI